MKKILFGAALMITVGSSAQQLPLFSQYMQNAFVINPAVAGTQGYTEFRSMIRNQWTGLKNETNFGSNPKTTTLSLNTGWDEKKIGIGGYIFTDKIGPVSKTGFNATYAYHIVTGKGSMLSFGASGLFYLYRLNTSELKFETGQNMNVDKVLNDGNFHAYTPNMSFGIYYKAKKYHLGFSIPEMVQSQIGSAQDFFVVQERRHVFIDGGVVLKISDNVDIDPSMLVKYVSGAPAQIDANVCMDYKKILYFGASYRSGAALSLMFGYTYKNAFKFGYAYDLTTSGLSTYAKGTHEICIGYNIFRKKPEESSKEKPSDTPLPPPKDK